MAIQLKPEVKTLWIEALRSGKYQQGIGALQNEEGKFCCLGVLCDLHMKNVSTKEKWEPDTTGSRFKNKTYYRARSYLPPQVNDWALDKDPEEIGTIRLVFDNSFRGLDSLNDYYKLSFQEISDLIEKQL